MRTGGLASELAGRHEVRVLSQRWDGFPVAEPPPGVTLRTVDVSRWGLVSRLPAVLLRTLAGRPAQVSLHDHGRFRRRVREEVATFRPQVAVVVLSRLGGVLRELEQVPTVVDLVDALALNMRRRAERQPWLRGFWTWEARRLERWDLQTVRRAGLATVVAERDRRALVASGLDAEEVRVVPLGLAALDRSKDPRGGESKARSGESTERDPIVALTGNLGYFPTVDGAQWFASNIWPQVKRRVPRAQWWLAGARPAPVLQRLAREPGIHLFADPPDLAELARRATVAVAPLRSGSGTPIKILEAMAGEVPVVTTPDGRAGLDALPDGAIRSAASADDFARHLVHLLEDDAARRRQAGEALAWLYSRHRLEVSAREFEAVLQEAVVLEGAVVSDG